MITVKTMKQIATSSVIPSCRALPRLGGNSLKNCDRARIASGTAKIQASVSRQQWLNGAYLSRLER